MPYPRGVISKDARPRALLALLVAGLGAGAALPPAAHAEMTLRWDGAVRVDGREVTVPGHTLHVRGTVTPFVAGQEVTVRVNVGFRRVLLTRVPITPDDGSGTFTVAFRVPRVAPIKASALHQPTAELGRLAATAPRVTTVVPVAGRGARGLRVRFLQTQLARLHYGVTVTGYYNAATARAVLAYRKANVMARMGFAGRAVFTRLAAGLGAFPVVYPTHGRHAEVDLGRQVLALVNPGGRVYRIYPISSGTPSTPTVQGGFRVYLKTPGTNARGMVHSSYFIGGYAIHGYKRVPTRPASNGCVRIPIPIAAFVHRWLRVGTRVDVYYRSRGAPRRQPVNPNPGP
jgi:L,D-transpeptidase catalytic domain/Putative peptidoglycan binding domain